MKFRHKVETVNINGLREFSVNYFLCDELIVGRGSGCLIRLSSRLVALSHAKLSLVDGKLTIEDLQTDSGTRVNDVLVKKHILKDGDRVKIGDVQFTTFFDGTYWGLHEVREEKPEEDKDSATKKQLRMLDLSRYYPRFTTFSALIVATVGLIGFVEPYVGMNPALWNSGPISNPHRMIENNCKACHAKPFEPVRDKECMSCHQLTAHAPTLAKAAAEHPEINFRCAECHHEHNGTEGILEKSSQLCITCHGELDKLVPGTKHPSITSFYRHPEFRVTIPQYDENGDATEPKRVSFTDDVIRDTTRLKLNHRKHLVKDLRSPDGPKTLDCADCHRFSADLKTIVPITFEANCRSCHPLGFDERLPDRQVPHGGTDIVYNFVYAEYAKLFLNTEKENTRQDFVRRFKPGREVESEAPSIDFTKQFVEQESRKAEQELFTRTACFLCHEVRPATDTGPGKSNFRVLRPNLPQRWMPETIFSHGTHQELSCDSCHHGVRTSAETSDVLLPRIADCRSCHKQQDQPGKVVSNCSMCHSYHQPEKLPDKTKRGARDVLSRP